LACGKRIFDKQNLKYVHLITTDFNIEKNITEIDDIVIDRVASEITKEI